MGNLPTAALSSNPEVLPSPPAAPPAVPPGLPWRRGDASPGPGHKRRPVCQKQLRLQHTRSHIWEFPKVGDHQNRVPLISETPISVQNKRPHPSGKKGRRKPSESSLPNKRRSVSRVHLLRLFGERLKNGFKFRGKIPECMGFRCAVMGFEIQGVCRVQKERGPYIELKHISIDIYIYI